MKWVLRIMGALVMALVLLGGLVFLIPKERIASLVAEQARIATGRDVQISEIGGLTFWPSLGLRTGTITVANADWASGQPLFEAQSLTISVSARGALRGEVLIQNVTAEGAVLRLEQDAIGRQNWNFANPEAASAPQQADPTVGAEDTSTSFALDRLALTGAQISMTDAGAEVVDLRDIDLDLTGFAAEGPTVLTAKAHLAEDPVLLNLRIASVQSLLTGTISGLSAHVENAGGSATFNGQAGLDGWASGEVSVQTVDMPRFLAGFGLTAPDSPPGLGRDLTFGAEVDASPERVLLADIDLASGENSVSGWGQVAVGQPPLVTARLEAGRLDLSQTVAAEAAGPASDNAAQEGGSGWSTAPIDASALHSVDLDITLTTPALILPQTRIEEVDVTLTSEQGRAVMNIASASVFGGQVTGSVVANARGGFSTRADVKANGLDVQQLLTDMTGASRLSGTLSGQVAVLGVGDTQDALMRSLDGSGWAEIGDGALRGFDLLALIQGQSGGGGTTVFDRATGSFSINAGNLQNSDLLVSHARYRATGVGRIGIGARDLDYALKATLFGVLAGKDLSVPVKIRGDWDAPLILPDLDAALAQQARAALEQKAQEALGNDAGDGRSVEEQIKDRLEEEAGRQIRRLFGSN